MADFDMPPASEVQAKKAFLDALAAGESTALARAEKIDPYFILYGGGSFENLPRTATGFPLWEGKDNSHAAGRYQFEPRTWAAQAVRLHLTDFSPASQDIAAWDLAATVYNRIAVRDLLRDLIADKLDLVVEALQSTWTSLNPYTFPVRFRAALAGSRNVPIEAVHGILLRPDNLEEPVQSADLTQPAIGDLIVLISTAVRALQTALAAKGFDPGPIDGIWGDRTKAAIEAWKAAGTP